MGGGFLLPLLSGTLIERLTGPRHRFLNLFAI
jgi:hypothetical protein